MWLPEISAKAEEPVDFAKCPIRSVRNRRRVRDPANNGDIHSTFYILNSICGTPGISFLPKKKPGASTGSRFLFVVFISA